MMGQMVREFLEAGIPMVSTKMPSIILGGGFKYFLFSPLLGEMIQFDEHTFQLG